MMHISASAWLEGQETVLESKQEVKTAADTGHGMGTAFTTTSHGTQIKKCTTITWVFKGGDFLQLVEVS